MSSSLGENKPTPDPYTNEWYREQFNKMQYHWNRSMTEEVALSERFNAVSALVRKLDSQRSNDMAKIGELSAKITELTATVGELQERLDKASKVVAELKAKKSN
jgi:chromosome segregation ATPase